jgi:Phage tail lysozyme
LMRDFSPLADFQAAGAVGNGGHESAGFTQIQEKNPTKPGSKGGYGFFQWTGMGTAAAPGRRRVFENLLKELGLPPDRYEANYEMLRRELRGPEKRTMPALRRTQTIEEAAESFMRIFERPGVLHLKSRIDWSRTALAAYRAEERKIAKDPPVVAMMAVRGTTKSRRKKSSRSKRHRAPSRR